MSSPAAISSWAVPAATACLAETIAIARLADVRARAAAERTGLLAALGPEREFRSVQEALNALTPARTP
jgi:hypothetical protein